MYIGFTKMHGLGNDFVVIDNMNGRISLTKEQVIFLCDRHKGIGADGVILVEPKEGSDCFMNYINSDGTEAEMCGNGVRCTAKFFQENFAKDKKEFKIATRSGIKEIIHNEDDTYSVNMGKASFSSKDFEGERGVAEGVELNFVSMGNPFAIAFVENVEKEDLKNIGPAIENNKMFPNRINFEIVEELGKDEFKVRVWERGCGETLACGSGACAVYALVKKLGKAEGEITVHFPGGKLYLSSQDGGDIIMRGIAEASFSGMVELL